MVNQAACDCIQRSRGLYHGVLDGESFQFFRCRIGESSDFGDFVGALFVESDARIESSSDSGAAEGEVIDTRQYLVDTV